MIARFTEEGLFGHGNMADTRSSVGEEIAM